jgi:hypothetical protein
MVESPKPSSIQVKDYIVVVPTLGTALAISWEVGSFLPIGGIAFGAFSLTEHLVFALQALPIGFIVALVASAVITMRGRSRIRLILTRLTPAKALFARALLLALILASSFAGLLLGLSYTGSTGVKPYFIGSAVGLGGIVFVFAMYSDMSNEPFRNKFIGWTLFYFIFFAFNVGVEQTRVRIARAEVSDVETDIRIID